MLSAQVLTVCQAALAISPEPFPLHRRLWLRAALAGIRWREVAARHRHLWAAKLAWAGLGWPRPAAEASVTFSVLASTASSSSCSSLDGLSRLGPRQEARLLQVILLVDLCWTTCRSSASSCLRRSRFAVGNFLATLRGQEGSVHQADVAHRRPQSWHEAGGSQRLWCTALQAVLSEGVPSWAGGPYGTRGVIWG